MDELTLIAFFAVFVGLVLAMASSRPTMRRLGAIAAILATAGAAQWLMLEGLLVYGSFVYIAAAAALLLWVRIDKVDFSNLSSSDGWSRWQEAGVLISTIGIAAVFRLWRFGDVPYGIEQDEAQWTWEMGYKFFSDLEPGGTAFHFESFPVGFYQGALFLRLFGLEMLSSRIEIVFFSLFATVLFYLLVRRLFSVPVALFATFFLAISAIDVSASRVALFEAKVKFWVILSFFLFVWATQRRDLKLYLLTGGALAAGMLVYQTFFLIPLVVVSSLLVKALGEREQWRHYAAALLAVMLPLLLVAPTVWNFVQAQEGFTTTRWVTYTAEHPYDSTLEKVVRAFQFAWHNFGEIANSVFYRQHAEILVTPEDFFFNRLDGPVVLAAVIPLAVLGTVIALANAKNFRYAFVLLWLLLGFFVAGLATGRTFVRVLYPGLPAVYVLAGIATSAFVMAVHRHLERSRAIAFGAGLIVFAAVLIGVSWQVYFEESLVFPGREQRREMLDVVSEGAAQAELVLLPYLPGEDDRLDRERVGVGFAVGSEWGLSDAGEHHEFVVYEELLAAIRGATSTLSLAIVHDKSIRDPYRTDIISVLSQCYPDLTTRPGRFFDLIRLDQGSIAASRCYSSTVLAEDPGGPTSPSTEELTFNWNVVNGNQQSFQLVIERLREGVQLLEAEDELAGHLWFEDASVSGFRGRGVLVDSFDAGRAEATISIPVDGRYELWVRFNERVLTDAQAFLYVDETSVAFGADASLLEWDEWIWKSVGSFELFAGQHTLGVEKTYGADRHVGLLLDTLAMSSDPSFDPRVHDIWEVVLDSGERASPERRFVLDPNAEECSACTPDGLRPGRYRWRVRVFDQDQMVDSLGSRGAPSETLEFEIESR